MLQFSKRVQITNRTFFNLNINHTSIYVNTTTIQNTDKFKSECIELNDYLDWGIYHSNCQKIIQKSRFEKEETSKQNKLTEDLNHIVNAFFDYDASVSNFECSDESSRF